MTELKPDSQQNEEAIHAEMSLATEHHELMAFTDLEEITNFSCKELDNGVLEITIKSIDGFTLNYKLQKPTSHNFPHNQSLFEDITSGNCLLLTSATLQSDEHSSPIDILQLVTKTPIPGFDKNRSFPILIMTKNISDKIEALNKYGELLSKRLNPMAKRVMRNSWLATGSEFSGFDHAVTVCLPYDIPSLTVFFHEIGHSFDTRIEQTYTEPNEDTKRILAALTGKPIERLFPTVDSGTAPQIEDNERETQKYSQAESERMANAFMLQIFRKLSKLMNISSDHWELIKTTYEYGLYSYATSDRYINEYIKNLSEDRKDQFGEITATKRSIETFKNQRAMLHTLDAASY